METNYGAESERILHELASLHFISDFVFPNPPYFKKRQKRELADMLVMVEDTLLVFQVKSHQWKKDSPHNIGRIQKKLLEAWKQFRVFIEAADSLRNAKLKNQRGVEIDFDISSFKAIFLIFVVDVLKPDDVPPIRLRTLGFNCLEVPVFAAGFEAADLQFLLHQCDTVPDFTTYISCLTHLENTVPDSIELSYLEILAFLRLYPEEISALLEKGTKPIHLKKGIDAEYLKRSRAFEMEISYMVDDFIEWLHRSIGTALNLPEGTVKDLVWPENSVQGFWKIANRLANLPRLQRQALARLMYEKRYCAGKWSASWGALISSETAILVYATESERPNRIKELGGLCLSLLSQHENFNAVVGLGFPPHGQREGESDAIFIDRDWAPDLSSFKSDVDKHGIFAPPREIVPDEFLDAIRPSGQKN